MDITQNEVEEFHYNRSKGTMRIVTVGGFVVECLGIANIRSVAKVDLDVEYLDAFDRADTANLLTKSEAFRASIEINGNGPVVISTGATHEQG